MQRLEVSGAVRPIHGSLGVKRLILELGGYVLSISRLGRMAMATFTGSNQSDSEDCITFLKISCLSLQSILNICRLFFKVVYNKFIGHM